MDRLSNLHPTSGRCLPHLPQSKNLRASSSLTSSAWRLTNGPFHGSFPTLFWEVPMWYPEARAGRTARASLFQAGPPSTQGENRGKEEPDPQVLDLQGNQINP